MKLVCTEATLDKRRVIFYFTAEKRIDFRELVKDLASRFKTRIEMRQIGVRDSARVVGSLGICGRELCCTRFLTSFEPISIKMAKKQELVLNTNKLSGSCGRLMCCLGFEYSEAGREQVPDTVLQPEIEDNEVIAPSPDLAPETAEAAPEVTSAAVDSGPHTRQPGEHPRTEKKEKRRKWYPRKRRKKPENK